jgi:hypothetical protein
MIGPRRPVGLLTSLEWQRWYLRWWYKLGWFKRWNG